MKKIKDKYDNLSVPILEKQNQLICGERGVEKEEIQNANEYLNENEKVEDVLEDKSGLSDYWLKCFKNADVISSELKEKDHDLLKSLKKI